MAIDGRISRFFVYNRHLHYNTKQKCIFNICTLDLKRYYTENPSKRTTHFGYQTVPEEEKENLVGHIFDKVSGYYDRMNDIMSLGLHRCWKDTFIDRINPQNDTSLLDVAGGTGDIAFRFLRRAEKAPKSLNYATDTFKATVIDINPNMLKIGMQRSTQQLSSHLQHRIEWLEGNAEHLIKIPDASVDLYTIAFGIRNCTHTDLVLKEAFRVLKPGGMFYCLEFSKPNSPLSSLYDLWSFQIIPRIGQIVFQDKASYQYLVESIRQFPSQEEFRSLIKRAGFLQVHYENLFGGVAAIHSGIKLE